MTLTVLSVAYPMAPVGPDTVGGSEQVLGWLDRALVAAGHRSLVVACAGSQVAGELIAGPPLPPTPFTWQAHAAAQEEFRRLVADTVRRRRVDLVHMHALDFYRFLPPPGVPALITLHLPPDWYPDDEIDSSRPDTWVSCVSRAQTLACPPSSRLVPPVPNGVPVAALGAHRHAKRSYALMLARVCPEKGHHLALDAARAADVPLLLGGQVYGYPEHQAYFDAEVAPRLDARRRFLGPLGFARKRRLLSGARCVLIPSLCAETSSLVAMEAAACGTPVVALARGALPETVEHGRTGILVDDPADLAAAIARADAIDPEECRRVARERFTLERMVAGYLSLYERLAARPAAVG